MSRRNHKIIAETDEIGTEKTISNKNGGRGAKNTNKKK